MPIVEIHSPFQTAGPLCFMLAYPYLSSALISIMLLFFRQTVCFYFRAVFKFEGTHIFCSAKGTQFEKFREQVADDERAFGYIRLQVTDGGQL